MPSSNKRPGGSDDGDDRGESPHKVARLALDQHQQHQQQQQQQQHHDYTQQYHGQLQHDGGNGGDYNNHSNGANGTSSSGGKKKGGGGGSTRTGQACDRCKIRKIRCDARPGGCSPCLQNNSECKTTDRITGRATSRGHTEVIENENASLKMYLLELQQQLKENGVEPKPPQVIPHGHMPTNASIPFWGQGQNGAWNPDQHGAYPPSAASASAAPEERSAQTSLLPDFRAGCIGDNYLGVQSGNNWLSPIEGTSLALFGTKIDLAEFMPSEHDPLTSAMSYRTFLSHAFGRAQPFVPTMPPYEQCKVYAEWFFRSVTPFTPVLHKPHFMDLLDRIHHQNYQPTHAETVMVHMVLAIINFQFSSRNSNEQARHDAMSHYQYALKFIPDLITGHKLEDIQALTLICSQLRNQPRPGAAWMFTNMVMGVALESGLHRSAKAWQTSPSQRDAHHLEMRKRTFWSLLILHVHISGKLGRPMPFRMEDFDIEIPDAVDDTVRTENGTENKICSFRAGIEGFKLVRIIIQIYSSIYSVKSTGQYDANLRHLDKELAEWEAQVPVEFSMSQAKDEDRVCALYLDMGMAEAKLLLHHPSLCRSMSEQTMQSNLDSCLTWSSRLLASATQLKDRKSLDTTWYSSVNFLAAIFTTLFAYTERRDTITSSDLTRLRQDMDQWLAVFAEVGALLGALPQLQVAVRSIIEISLGNLSRVIAAKTASAAVASTTESPSEPQPQQHTHQPAQAYDNASYSNNTSSNTNGYSQPPSQSNPDLADSAYSSYPPTFHYPSFDGTYPQHQQQQQDVKPNPASLEAQLNAHNNGSQPPQPSNGNAGFMAAYTDALSTNNFMANGGTEGYGHSHPAAWRHFADHMMMSVVGNDMLHANGTSAPNSASTTAATNGLPTGGQQGNGYMNDTSGLMSLSSGVNGGGVVKVPDHISSMEMAQAALSGHGGQVWPLMNYSGGIE
ncbi:unnamed protein product [Zymoseptoria tritici ST99CH_3D1]|nr:unnamed protein product [Zymoseptoria tritici ST99CH_3D1]